MLQIREICNRVNGNMFQPPPHPLHARRNHACPPPAQIDMQEQQIRQLEHHAAQLKDSLQAGGLISKSVSSPEKDKDKDNVAADDGVDDHPRNQGVSASAADGEKP